MSLRQARLCDKRDYQPDVCGHLAIGACCLCDADICQQHAAYATKGLGALVVTVRLRRDHRDGEQTVNAGEDSLHVCSECINKTSAFAQSRMREITRECLARVREAFRAALAEAALAKQGGG